MTREAISVTSSSENLASSSRKGSKGFVNAAVPPAPQLPATPDSACVAQRAVVWNQEGRVARDRAPPA